METESLNEKLLVANISGLDTSQTVTNIKEGMNCMAEVTEQKGPNTLISVLVEYTFVTSAPHASSKKPRKAARDLEKETQNQDSNKGSTWKKIERKQGSSTTNPSYAVTIGSKRRLSEDEAATFKESGSCGKRTKIQDATHIKLLSTVEAEDQPRRHQ